MKAGRTPGAVVSAGHGDSRRGTNAGRPGVRLPGGPRDAALRHDLLEAAPEAAGRRRAAWVPVVVSGLGGRADQPPPRSRWKPPLRMSSRTRSRSPTRARICSSDGNSSWMMGVCHRDEVTHSIAIPYSCICNRFPSSYPSFAIRCPRALKTLCGRLEIVDRRDDHALIRRCGAPSPPPPLSPNDDQTSARDAYAWPADRGTIEPNRRAGRSCTSCDVRACSAAGAEPHATLDDAGTAETLLIQWQWWKRRESNPNHVIF